MTSEQYYLVQGSWRLVRTDMLIRVLARHLFQGTSAISIAAKDDPQRFCYSLVQVVGGILRSPWNEVRLPTPLIALAEQLLVRGFKAAEIDLICGTLMRAVCQQLGVRCTVETLAAWSAFDKWLRKGIKSVLAGDSARKQLPRHFKV